MKKAISLFVAIMFIAALMNSCAEESLIPSEEAVDYQKQQNASPLTKVEVHAAYYFHESTNLLLQYVPNSRFLAYNSSSQEGDTFSGYALKISPRSYLEQKQIEQIEGIKVSYIPFGYEPVYMPAGTDIRSIPSIPLPDDTRTITVSAEKGKANDNADAIVISGPSQIKLPSLYVEWPKELALPDGFDYEILFIITKQPEPQRIVYPSKYWLVFQTYDSVLSSNVRLKNLKIRVSKSGSVISEQLTDSQGRIKITSDQALYESEPLTYSITTVSSSPKWTITRDTTNTIPIHTALGTLSQYFDYNNPLDTIFITLSSVATEFEIHRAIDYYRNDSHELSSTILSSENSLLISAPNYSSQIYHGKENWNNRVSDGADIVIFNNGLNTQNLMGVILHEIGHARKDYAQGTSYNNSNSQLLIHESYASFIGYHLSRKYYISKGYSLSGSNYYTFNDQHRQNWTYGLYNTSPLFVDLTDDLNEHSMLYIYVDDTISGVPILSIDRLGALSIDLPDFVTNISPLIGVYFAQSQLNTMLSYYSNY